MENKTKHTPGPWTTNNGFTILSAKGKTASSDVPNKTITDDEAIANAALIAAAPDLLAALEFCSDALNTEAGGLYKAHIEQARAAIAKAEGKPC